MKEIVVYVEGGGNTVNQCRQLREGFDRLFSRFKVQAPQKNASLRFVCCGSRDDAYNDFCDAIREFPNRVNVLLVDSEEGVPPETADKTRNARGRASHLTRRDGWDLTSADPKSIHLMVQCMEAWIVADPDALARFYGQRFARNVLPTRQNLEDEPKQDIYEKLARATRNTQKGEYKKIKHASKLLERIDPSKVVQRCPRFSTFTQWLDKVIGDA